MAEQWVFQSCCTAGRHLQRYLLYPCVKLRLPLVLAAAAAAAAAQDLLHRPCSVCRSLQALCAVDGGGGGGGGQQHIVDLLCSVKCNCTGAIKPPARLKQMPAEQGHAMLRTFNPACKAEAAAYGTGHAMLCTIKPACKADRCVEKRSI
eukprot:1154636-Pelagomonas_calceolata.AAC.3